MDDSRLSGSIQEVEELEADNTTMKQNVCWSKNFISFVVVCMSYIHISKLTDTYAES